MTLEELAQKYPLDSFQLDFNIDTGGWTLTALFAGSIDEGHEHIDRFRFHADTIEDVVALLSLKCSEVFDVDGDYRSPPPVLSDNDN